MSWIPWHQLKHGHVAERHVKDTLQIAASMQALTLVLVTPVPQGAHWLIRKQVHSGDQPLHPLQ